MAVPLAAPLCRTTAFAEEATHLVRLLPDGLSVFVKYDSIKDCFREAARIATRRLGRERGLPAA